MRVIEQKIAIPISQGFDEFGSAEVVTDEDVLYLDTITGQYVSETEAQELNLLDEVEKDMDTEKTLGKDARYIVLARKYLPALRQMFWRHHDPYKQCLRNREEFNRQMKDADPDNLPQSFINEYGINEDELNLHAKKMRQAQDLIRQLSLQQTEPLAAIDSNPNIDSYTGQLIPYGEGEDVPPLEFPLEGHQSLAPDSEAEVGFTLKEEDVKVSALAMLVAYDILYNWNKSKSALPPEIKYPLIDKASRVVNDSWEIREDVQAFLEIIEDKRKVVEQSIPNPVRVFTKLPRDMISVAITESYHHLFRSLSAGLDEDGRKALAEKFEASIKHAINATRHMLDFNDDDKEQMMEDIDMIPSVPLLQNETEELNVSVEEVSEMRRFLSRKTKKFRKEIRLEFDLCKRAGMTDAEAEETVLVSVPNIPETQKLIDAINDYKAENQDKAFFVLSFGWLDGCLDKIFCEGYDSMESFCDLWADRILEQAWDAKFGTEEPSDEEVWRITKGWENEYANRLPVKAKNARNTRIYFLGAMSVIGTESDLDEAGMAAWRREQSFPASRAYDYALAHPRKEAVREAWAAFYHTAKVIDANRNRVTVETVIPNGRTGEVERQELDWALFFYRAKRLEVFVPKDCPQAVKDWVSQQIKIRNLQELIPTLKQIW